MLDIKSGSELNKNANMDKGFCDTLMEKGIASALQKLTYTPEPPSLDNCKVNCNSLLYKIQYSDQLKSRDIVLEIASYCEQFSLQNFFISLTDVGKLL